jgi:hypothetical protein
MISRSLLLSLGRETSEQLQSVLNGRKTQLGSDARQTIYLLADNLGDPTSDDLLRLVDLGKSLRSAEVASERITSFVDNFDTGGISKKQRNQNRKRRNQRRASNLGWKDVEGGEEVYED